MKIIPVQPAPEQRSDADPAQAPTAPGRNTSSRRTFGRGFPSRRTFGFVPPR